jgi:predicted phage terminase large subunit-like protein
MSFHGLTEEEYAIWRRFEWARGADSLLDFVHETSRDRGERPVFQRPDHLAPLAAAFARALEGPQRLLLSVPPRHGKTETLLHGIAWWLWLNPRSEVIYSGYSGTFAEGKSKRVRDIVQALGVPLSKDTKRANEWKIAAGGGLRARGRGGSITGHGANLLIIDDPISNREEAESAVVRQNTFDWFTSTAMTRVEPGGSVIVVHTRWHDDDLIGRLAEQGGWDYINLPALTPVGSLWPARWSVKDLEVRRREVGEYDWSSMFQGEPRPRGGRLFNPITERGEYTHPFISDLELAGRWRIVIGADPAATEKTSADYSVAVVLAVTGEPGTISYRADVLDVWRGQVEIPKFAAKLVEMSRHWNAPVVCESQGGFKAVPQMMRLVDKDVIVFEITALGDKFTRALPASAAWNDGRIRVPVFAPWRKDFLAEVTKFTGVKDAKDDQVDALAHAFNALAQIKPLRNMGVFQAPRDLVGL